MSKTRAALCALTVVPLLSCSALGPLGKQLEPYTPKVRFKTLQLNSIDWTRASVDFEFYVDNPNPLQVKVDQFAYAMALGGVKLLQGTNKDGLRLKASGSSVMALPVTVVFSELFEAVSGLSGKEKVPFDLRGYFGFDTPLGLARVKFRETGNFPVVHMPDVSLEGVRLGKLDLLGQRASLNIDLGVANTRGGSPLTFDGFDYKIGLGGRSVAGGIVKSLANVAAGKKQTVSLPIDLNLGAVAGSVINAVTKGGAMDVTLAASVTVGTPLGAIPLSVDEKGNFRVGK
jgi:LEA14-like dessication related protein